MKLTLASLVLLAGLTAWGQAVEPPSGRETVGAEQQWGVQIVSLRLSAAGHLVDFRYKVLDPQKAKPLAARQTKPYLESGEKQFPLFNAPRVGPLRSTYQPEEGKVYGMMFVNSHLTLSPGDKVTVVIGDFKADGVITE